MRPSFSQVALLCAVLGTTPFCAHAATVTHLRCEEVLNPLGVESLHPRLSWQTVSNGRGWIQGTYHILVASSPQLLARNQGDLWDSGEVRSNESVGITYNGKPLSSGRQYFWKVQVRDAKGVASSYSPSAHWGMGLLASSDWHGEWLGYVAPRSKTSDATPTLEKANWIWYPEGDPTVAVPAVTRWFRRTLTLPAGRPITGALLRVAADNAAVISVNGKEVGRAHDSWKSRKVFDLKENLVPGRNVIAIAVTNEAGASQNPAGLAAQLDVRFQSGEPLSLVTDGDWKSSTENAPNWQSLNFDDSNWIAAKSIAKTGSGPWGAISNGTTDTGEPAPYFRHTFALNGRIKRATAYICGLGYYEMSLNGRKVGDHMLDPGWTRYDRRALYVAHDVTRQLKSGRNAIGIVLGSGHYDDHVLSSWDFDKAPWRTRPKMRLELRVEYEDGRQQLVSSDRTWKATTGPIRFDSISGGENYDARLETAGWDTAAFQDANWDKAQIVPPVAGILSAQIAPPIRVTQVLKPVKVTQPKPGVWIFDLGQDFAGVPQLHVSGPRGTTVTMRSAEKLHADGTLDAANIDAFVKRQNPEQQFQTENYTLKGGQREVWNPRFTYHGFRYVEVKGFPGTPTLDNLRGLVLHSDFESVGHFECSNQNLNRIQHNTLWSYRSNFHSIPTDCPHREKNGWTGDAHLAAETGLYNFDGLANYEKWLNDIYDEQRDSGALPGIVPTGGWGYSWGNGPAWDSAYPLIVWYLYQYRNDRHVLDAHYDRLCRYVDYVTSRSPDLIPTFGLDDWVAPKTKTPVEVTNTGYYYVDTCIVADIATVLGKEADAQRYRELATRIKTAFNTRFLNPQTNSYANGSLTALSCALYQGLVPDDRKAAVVESLVAEVKKQKYQMDVGILGAKYVLNALADNGYADVAYQMIQQKSEPGYINWLDRDATTLWEQWDGEASRNHIMFGDVSAWFYKYLAGISYGNTGFKNVDMQPHLLGDLKEVNASYDSERGRIASHWKLDDRAFSWDITVPANTTATVWVPAAETDIVTESGRAIPKDRVNTDVNWVYSDGKYQIFAVGSGTYRFKRAIRPTN